MRVGGLLVRSATYASSRFSHGNGCSHSPEPLFKKGKTLRGRQTVAYERSSLVSVACHISGVGIRIRLNAQTERAAQHDERLDERCDSRSDSVPFQTACDVDTACNRSPGSSQDKPIVHKVNRPALTSSDQIGQERNGRYMGDRRLPLIDFISSTICGGPGSSDSFR